MFGETTLKEIQINSKLPEWNALMQPSDIITKLFPYFFGAAGIILLLMLISAGYQIMMSKGDPKAMQAAQAKITTSMIGLILLFTAFWIVRLIGRFMGITVFEGIFGGI